MSPEQARGRIDEIDAKSDQFSLALIVYEMLTGQTAFQGDNVSSVVYQIVHEEPRALDDPNGPIPPLVAAVLKRALAKDKERRFSTVKAFADALEEAATAPSDARATTMASHPSLLDASVREAPRSPRRLRLGVGLAALAIVGVTAWGLLRHERPKANDPSASSAPAGPPAEVRPPASAPAPAPTVARKPPEPEPTATVAVPEPSKREAPKTNHRPKAAITPKPAIAPKPAQPAPQRTNCDPNYYVDAQGFKHFKPECFLEKKAGP
jgi:serine/threonine-protein kinase